MTYTTTDHDSMSQSIRKQSHDDETFCKETMYHYTVKEWSMLADLICDYAAIHELGGASDNSKEKAHEIGLQTGLYHQMQIKHELASATFDNAA